MKRIIAVLLIFLVWLAFIQCAWAQSRPQNKKITVGFFEGGEYPGHSAFRSIYTDALKELVPGDRELVFVPQGFKSAGWIRERSREMAAELTADTSVHLIVALGPWVVEDLLAAECTKPIIAACRFDPVLENLVDDNLRPIVDNLTVRVRPGKIENELTMMAGLLAGKRLGFLYFPSGDESRDVLAAVQRIAGQLGFRVTTAEGYDNSGTYAYFKAYKALPGKIDALYVAPLWGFTPNKINQFYGLTNRDRIPTMASDGRNHVERGALFSTNAESVRRNAWYHAWKTARIIDDHIPADLPVVMPEMSNLVVNESTAQMLGFELPDDLRHRALRVAVPVGSESGVIGLTQAVDQSLQQNPGYLATQEVIQEALKASSQTKSHYMPHVGLFGSVGYADDNKVHNYRDEITNESYRLGITLDQTLLSVETIRTIQLSVRNSDVSQLTAERAALDLELAVTAAYLGVLYSEDVLQESRTYRDRVEEIVQIAEVKQHFGEGEYADFVRWSNELSRAIQTEIVAEASLDIARVLLNVLLNQPGNTPVSLDRVSFSKEQNVQEFMQLRPYVGYRPSLMRMQDYLVDQALRLNPDMRILDVNVDLQQILLARNKGRFYPKVGFHAELEIKDELTESTSFEEKHSQWSVGARLDLPLFAGGDRIHERGRLNAALSRVEYEKDHASLGVMQGVRTAAFRMASHATSLPFTEESQELADRFRELIFEGYFAGEKSYVELLDAEQSALEARLIGLRTRYSYFESIACLVREVGWSPHAHYRTASAELLARLAESGLGE